MADINTKLKRAMDGPAPQHKKRRQDEFEFSEGSNGALHMKVTDPATGEPVDPRQVSDHDALAELQAIKADIAETKQTQAEILTRLDGTFNTQLTGSSVDHDIITIFNGVEIRDTNRLTSNEINVYKYKSLEIWANSSLDSNVKIRPSHRTNLGSRNISYYDGTDWLSTYNNEAVLKSNNSQQIYKLSTFFPFLSDFKGNKIILNAQCDTPPSNGALTVYLVGVLN